jgi:histone H3
MARSKQTSTPSNSLASKKTSSKTVGGKSTGSKKLPAKFGKKGISETADKKIVKRRRDPTKIDRDIRRLQKSTLPALRKAPFRRLVREIAQDYKEDLRFQADALNLIQEASEKFLVTIYDNALFSKDASHGKRKSLTTNDMIVPFKCNPQLATSFADWVVDRAKDVYKKEANAVTSNLDRKITYWERLNDSREDKIKKLQEREKKLKDTEESEDEKDSKKKKKTSKKQDDEEKQQQEEEDDEEEEELKKKTASKKKNKAAKF